MLAFWCGSCGIGHKLVVVVGQASNSRRKGANLERREFVVGLGCPYSIVTPWAGDFTPIERTVIREV